MDVRSSHESASNTEGRSVRKKAKSVKSFINGLVQEAKKVNWTTKDELKVSTKVVIVSIFVFGLGIYVVDLVIRGVLDLVGKLA